MIRLHRSVSILLRRAGNKVEELRYYPFGETRYVWGNTPTDKRFTGQLALPDLGIYDYGARIDGYIKFGGGRWYSPLLGRFLSADTIVPRPSDPQSLNRYSYVRNSPINRVDPTGHIDIGALILGIGDQFFDDVSLGGWSALNVDVKMRFATEDSVDYNAGRVVGQVAALLTGGGEIGGGVSTVLGSLGFSGACLAVTAGACIPVAAGVSAAGVVGGTALAGHGVLVAGKVLSNGDPLTKAFSKGTSAEDVQQRIQRLEKGVGSLEQQVTEHQAKLEGYRQNPNAFDNQGLLRNAPTPAIRAKIIAGRIQKLEREIQKFHGEIQKMRAEIERLRQE